MVFACALGPYCICMHSRCQLDKVVCLSCTISAHLPVNLLAWSIVKTEAQLLHACIVLTGLGSKAIQAAAMDILQNSAKVSAD